MDSNTGYTLADGRDLSSVFMGMSNGVSLTSTNVFQSKQTCLGGIDLSACPMFYSMPSTIVAGPIYPIGYTLDVSNTITGLTSGTVYNTTISSVPNGVWLTTATVILTKGSANYANNSFIRFDISGNTSNVLFSPPTYPFLRLPIQPSNTNTVTLQLAVSGVAVIQAGPTSLYVETVLQNTTTSGTTINVYFEITKIA